METRGSTSTGSGGRSPIPLILLWAAIGLVFMGMLIGVIVWVVASIPAWFPGSPALVPSGAAGRPAGLLAASVTAAALMGAGAAGAVGILRQRSTERTHHLERQRYELEQARHNAEIVSRLRDRYAKAAEQLGHQNAAVRLAGVYATAGLADDWISRGERSEAQTCIDLLCAYLRVPRPTADTKEAVGAELEVRQTITRVITGHLQDPDDDASWCGMDFDFTGAIFDGNHSFSRAHFTSGDISFRESHFIGGVVDFTEAHFTGGTVHFTKANLTDGTVSFYGARFTTGTVDFTWAIYTGGTVDFTGVVFAGGTVDFTGGHFDGSNVYFTEVCFAGSTVVYSQSHFTGGMVSFYEAHITGGKVSFCAVRFRHGTIRFNGMHFTGGTVSFYGAHFAQDVVDFSEAYFTGGAVDFHRANGRADGPWGDELPNSWPVGEEGTSAEPRTAEG